MQAKQALLAKQASEQPGQQDLLVLRAILVPLAQLVLLVVRSVLLVSKALLDHLAAHKGLQDFRAKRGSKVLLGKLVSKAKQALLAKQVQ